MGLSPTRSPKSAAPPMALNLTRRWLRTLSIDGSHPHSESCRVCHSIDESYSLLETIANPLYWWVSPTQSLVEFITPLMGFTLAWRWLQIHSADGSHPNYESKVNQSVDGFYPTQRWLQTNSADGSRPRSEFKVCHSADGSYFHSEMTGNLGSSSLEFRSL